MLKGNDIVVKIGGVKLGAVKGCSIERNTKTIPVCSPFDGAAERHVPTTTSWSITTNGLYATKESAERLRDIWRQYQDGNHTLLDIEVVTEGVIVERGQAILTHLSDGCNVNELVKFDVQLLGSGKLEKQCWIRVHGIDALNKAEVIDKDINIVGVLPVWLEVYHFYEGGGRELISNGKGQTVVEIEIDSPYLILGDNEVTVEEAYWGARIWFDENLKHGKYMLRYNVMDGMTPDDSLISNIEVMPL